VGRDTNSALYELGPNGGVVGEINEHNGGYKGIAGTSTALYGPDGDGNLTVILGNKGNESELDLSVQAGTVAPGNIYTLTYTIENTGSTTIGDGDDDNPFVNKVLGQGPPGFVTNEGSIPDGGSVDGFTWFDWSIESGETLEANLEIRLPDDIDPGEYEFTILAEGTREYDETSGTVTVGNTGDISLALGITDTTAEAGGTATVTYILTNEGNAESSELQGRIDLPPGNWQLGESGSFTSLGPGESDSVSAEVLVPEDASGEYTIGGSVTDDAGNEASASAAVTVAQDNTPPNAAFTITPEDPIVGDTLTFDASGSNDPDGTVETYEWKVGDGDTFTPKGPEFTTELSEAGELTISLRVTDNDGGTDTVSKLALVGENTPPNAAFTVTPENPTVGDMLTLDGSESNDPDGTIETYEWKVGDGDTFTAEGPEFTTELSEVGEMTVSLRVTDNNSATDSITKTITSTDTISITDMKPVQIVANSRLEPPAQSSPIGSSAGEFPTYPPLVPGKGTGVIFDLDKDTLDTIPDGSSVVVNCTTDGEYSESTRVQYTKSELTEIADKSMLDSAFDDITSIISRKIPSIELPPDDQRSITLRIALATDQGEPIDPPLVEETIIEDVDFTCREPDEIRVGVAQLENPGSSSSQPYDEVEDFEQAVEEIEEALRNRFPTREEKITVKSTPDPVSGILPTGLPTPEEVNVNLVVVCVDQANGYTKLLSEFPSSDFDATLLIVPDGYFQENSYDDFSGMHIGSPTGGGVVQPQFAAMAEESSCPETALHELGHHFLPTDFYPDEIAQRGEGSQIDNQHARTQFRDVDDDGSIEDSPGVVSAAFNINTLSGYQRSTDAPGTMTYDTGYEVPDTLMYEKLLEGFEPRPPTAQLVGDGIRTVLSVIALIIDEGIEIIAESTHQGYPMPDVPDGDVTATIRDVDGNQIHQQTAPAGLSYHPTTAGSGAPSELTSEPTHRMSVPISEEAEEVEFEQEAGATETVSLSESPDEPASDDNEQSDDGIALSPEVLGGLGIGSIGILYLASRMLSNNDDDDNQHSVGTSQRQTSQHGGGTSKGPTSRHSSGVRQGQPSHGDSGNNNAKRSTQFCPNCGETLSIEAQRCSNCGIKIKTHEN